MKLKTQIFLGFLFILLLTLILSGIFVYYLNGLGGASDKLFRENYTSIKASKKMIVSLAKMDQVVAKISLGKNYNEEILFSILQKEKQLFKSNLETCAENISEIGENNVIENITDDFAEYENFIEKLKVSTDRSSLYVTVLQRQNEILREECVNLNELNHSALDRKALDGQNLYYNAKIYVFIITIAVLLIGIIAILNIPKRIVQPIIMSTEQIKKIADGNYNLELDTNTDNEIGDLNKAINALCGKLKEYEASNVSEIKAQKSRIESVIKNLNDGLIILNENKEIIIVNTTASVILGEDEEKLIGKRAVDLALKNNIIRELMAAVQKNEDRIKGSHESDHKFLKIVTQNNKQEFYAKEIVKVYDKKGNRGKFLGYIITLKDITSFKKSDEAKTNFIATVSHELKTPLSAINMSLMLLQDHRFGSLNDQQTKITSSMKSEVSRLLKIVTELLDLSKVETGSIELDKKLVDPNLLLEYSTAPIEGQLEEKNIKLVKHVDPDVKKLMVDPEKISWVLINFLTNAIRYTGEGQEIYIDVSRYNDLIEFSVKDKGPGIEPDNIEKVFAKFVQLNKNDKNEKGSLGLGLAISKEVIEGHGGEIGVESDLGRGTRFYFSLPVNS